MEQQRLQRLRRRKTVALFFLVGLTTSLSINLLWAYGVADHPRAFLSSSTSSGDSLFPIWGYSTLLPLMLVGSYILAIRRRWLIYSFPSIERALISILILILGWNIYQGAYLWPTIMSRIQAPYALISCIYAVMIALALFVFTGVWDRLSAIGLIVVLICRPLVTDVSLSLFSELLVMARIGGFHILFPWVYAIEISLAVALQTGLCGYWLARNQKALFK